MTTITAPLLKLNNGVETPALVLGVFQSPPAKTVAAVELSRTHSSARRSSPPTGLDASL
jgi:hypothetical protein